MMETEPNITFRINELVEITEAENPNFSGFRMNGPGLWNGNTTWSIAAEYYGRDERAIPGTTRSQSLIHLGDVDAYIMRNRGEIITIESLDAAEYFFEEAFKDW